ncbi:MAG: hypothetical protein COY68_04300 [Candidatus Levybacteria bacterium CG_4_10_14_0_8_um_filter_35_23]|nr:MAG: hypothetical protein COY68_04300 [Candidatus Levybacteria bacterium CG_4_10_14_0_8_um_filter_35_23]
MTTPEGGLFGRGIPLSEIETRRVKVRHYHESDVPNMVKLMKRNFDGHAYSLYPKDVVTAYHAANRETDVKHAVHAGGTEVYIAETDKGELGGFILIRFNQDRIPRQNAYGELDLRRLHVNADIQGAGIGRALFETAARRAKELHVEYITTHASGSARLYFEKNGWKGKTVLDHMSKRGTSALIYAAEKPITPRKVILYDTPTHIVYAGSNRNKMKFLQGIVGDLPVIPIEADEDQVPDVAAAAVSKVQNAKDNLFLMSGKRPLIVSSDVRTDLMVFNPGKAARYEMSNRGKPLTLEETRRNFELLLQTARATKKPAPYVVRSATYIHNPLEPELDKLVENDVSVHLSEEGLATLSTVEGLREYQEEVYDKYGVDILEMAAGFALPIFIKRGYVKGLFHHPFECLPEREITIQRALDVVIGGIDEMTVRERIGY